MTTFELTPSQAHLVMYALNEKATRKRQSLRNLERRKELIIEQVGEKEYKHRIKLRENTACEAEKLLAEMKTRFDFKLRHELKELSLNGI